MLSGLDDGFPLKMAVFSMPLQYFMKELLPTYLILLEKELPG
jgi:hypothetical protein